VRGIFRRGPRLELVAGLSIALALPALSVVAAHAQALATQTTLSAETRDQGGHTRATVAIAVTGEDGLPAAGSVAIKDNGKQLAGVALDAKGQATAALDLSAGDHQLSAAYDGDDAHQASVSPTETVHALATAAADFTVSVSPATLSLTAGNAGTIVISVTPENNATLTAPMFVTLSCSGLSDNASCTPTPERLEILSTSTPTKPLTSSMVIQTYAASTTSISPASRPGQAPAPIAWGFLLPGVLGLGGLAWGTRRRKWLARLSLVAMVGLVTMLGTTGCNPRYGYKNHSPSPNPATPAGTYTVSVTAQSSNGVTSTSHSTSFVLTVK